MDSDFALREAGEVATWVGDPRDFFGPVKAVLAWAGIPPWGREPY